MERTRLTEATFETALRRAVEVLAEGGVILFPTDTLYGLGADAFSDEAVDKVYAIKGRDARKPMHCVVADLRMAEQYAEFSNDARLLADAFFPGPLTLILKKKKYLERGIARDLSTIGIRIPDNDFCLSLASEFGRPFTATSANAAGKQPALEIREVLSQLGEHASAIGLALDLGPLPHSLPSTVVDLSQEEPVIVREGAIPAADVWDIIRIEP